MILSLRSWSFPPTKASPLSSAWDGIFQTSSPLSATASGCVLQRDTSPSICWTSSWIAMTSLCSSSTWSHSHVSFWPVRLYPPSAPEYNRLSLHYVMIFSCNSYSCAFPGKFEEREDRVPKLDTLNSLGCMSSMNLVLTKQGLLHMELLLLETFQWNLYLPTSAHFIEYYLSIAVHEGDLHDGWPMTCLEKTKVYMDKYADYFLEVSLQGKHYHMRYTWSKHHR